MKGTRSAWLLASAVVAGCASVQPSRFHSLTSAAPAAAPAAALPGVTPTPLWDVRSVSLPAQVDVPQLVVRLPDQTLVVLEHDRWIAPLADELRAAVALRLASVAAVPAAAAGAAWQVTIDVRRFDAELGRAARLEADWTLRPAQGSVQALRCHGVFEQPVEGGVAAIAAGHRANVAQLGDAVAASLGASASAGSPRCAS